MLSVRKWVVLIAGIACLSLSAIFVKKADVNGLASAFYRVAIALAAVAPVYLVRKRERPDRRDRLLCLAAGVLFGMDLGFWNQSVMLSNATIPSILVNLSSIWVGVGAAVFLKEKTGAAHWLGNLLALAGVVIIVGADRVAQVHADRSVAYALTASVLFAGHTLLMKLARSRMSTLTVLFYSLIGSLLPLLAVCLVKRVPLAGFGASSWFYLVCIGLVIQVAGYFSVNYALGYLPSSKVTLARLSEPVLTAVLASVLLSEAITRREALGGAVVLVGLAVSLRRPRAGRGPVLPIPGKTDRLPGK